MLCSFHFREGNHVNNAVMAHVKMLKNYINSHESSTNGQTFN
uniref:Uncharacterized protein n=1 Tax=Siphoviridae sp. ct4Z13 TaxID=2827778 RepID=A0A8S5SCB2_9CAUD|nr:MAG TPA: hypothetical protein [Siphoviridae sp. ct4Z13]DAY94558.1 MAG TPA: hypothetical protein [Caudoviricetes sp.]